MDMLDWVRGPLLVTAVFVFVVGVAWRFIALWRLPASPDGIAPARQKFGTADALQASLSRMIPQRGFHPSATLVTVNPYVFISVLRWFSLAMRPTSPSFAG